jgi:hypothetical protein
MYLLQKEIILGAIWRRIMNENSWVKIDMFESVILTPLQIRNMVVQNFQESQGELFKRTYRRLQIEKNQESLSKTAEIAVRLAFREVGGDFENPTKQKLLEVLIILSKKSSSWGAPADMVKANREKFIALLQSIND